MHTHTPPLRIQTCHIHILTIHIHLHTDNPHSISKKDPRDFALWKLTDPHTPVGWQSVYGYGRPGWHIECSAMTYAYFGARLIIHSGGVDLKFPHHNNEILQR
ncbi:hypothetical protein EON65_11290 [archaeon]|nr:MAG: hypothetical protein EON65_11290 [archaeon]